MKLLCQGKSNEVSEDFDSFIQDSLKEGTSKEHLQVSISFKTSLVNLNTITRLLRPSEVLTLYKFKYILYSKKLTVIKLFDT